MNIVQLNFVRQEEKSLENKTLKIKNSQIISKTWIVLSFNPTTTIVLSLGYFMVTSHLIVIVKLQW